MHLQLTAAGNRRLEGLAELHRERARASRLARLPSAWRGLMPRQPLHGLEGLAQRQTARPRRAR